MSAVPITVPAVGESISEGIVSRWLKADGSLVKAGETVLELETDKATTPVPAPGSGVLKIGVAEGETVPIGATVGTIDPSGTPAAAPSQAPPAASAPVREQPNGQDGRPAEPAAAPATGTPERPLSPSVRRLVAEQGVDVAQVPATGPSGRVTKGDVLTFLNAPATAPATSTATAPAAAPPAAPAKPAPAASAGPRETRQRMSGLRQRIAQRLVEAQQTAAILTTFNEVDMSRVMEMRAQYKETFQKAHGTGLGFMSFFAKASIAALKAFPAVNARIDGNEIVYQNFYDIGVAVSTEKGLMVPVIRDADRLSFAGVEKAVAGFAVKAREGTISVDDLRGGTFTITNGGTFGSLLSTPILNPPQSAILGMHAIKKRPVVVDDQIVIRPMMYLALSYDHRLIDGREAVSFLVRVKDCIENPERMMFEI
ncbi:MAG: 2-oxoglutarate dehydrogenase complex dihydrolipoyllysine-residue succinyltransferase [Isosphaeraceae bacterium]